MCSGPKSPPKPKALPPSPDLPTTGQGAVLTDDGAGGLARRLVNLTNLGSPFLAKKPTGLTQISGAEQVSTGKIFDPFRVGTSAIFNGVSQS